jgi:copper transport protein
MHVYLFDHRDGSHFDETKELTVTAELPEKRIEPIEFESTKAGPGHFVMSGAALGVAGDWTVEMAARVNDFDEFRTKVEVPIR